MAVTGNMAASEAADTFAASGSVLVSGALSASEAPDTMAAVGEAGGAFVSAEDAAASSPVELYTFSLGSKTYRLTSHSEDYDFGGNTFSRSTLERESIEMRDQQGGELVVHLSRTEQLVEDAVFASSLGNMSVTVRRAYPEASAFIWRGSVDGVSFSGDRVTLRIASRWEGLFDIEVSRVLHQRRCNHRLYDIACGVNPDNHKVSTQVAGISNGGLTVSVGSVGGAADQTFKRGRLVHDLSGESRLVLSQVGTSIEIAWPIDGVSDGDIVELFAGCDLAIGTCDEKFDNRERFGGTPYIPADNIMRTRRIF